MASYFTRRSILDFSDILKPSCVFQVLEELKTRPAANERERQEMMAILKKLQQENEGEDDAGQVEEVHTPSTSTYNTAP